MARKGFRRLPPFKDYLFRAAVLLSLSFVALALVIVTYRPPAANHSQGEQPKTNQEDVQSKSFGEKLFDDPTAFFTMVLAGLTFVLAGVSSLQIYFLLSADRTTRLAARAAVKSADVAARTVRSIENTAERQLRAYIGIDRAYIENNDPLAGILKGKLVIKNAGQTPAHDVVCRILFDVYDNRLAVINVRDDDQKIDNIPAYIMPSGMQELRLSGELVQQKALELQSKGVLGFLLLGEILYTDAFGKKRVSNIRMCAPHAEALFQYAIDGNDAT